MPPKQLTAPNLRRFAVAVLISCVVSLVPMLVPGVLFLSMPGALLTTLLLGLEFRTKHQTVAAVCNVLVWSLGLYFGSILWKWGENAQPRQAPRATKIVFIFWLALLVPWLLWAPLSGMAFDGGYTPTAYAFVWSVWTYPVTVIIVAVLRRWTPWIVLLPVVNFAGCFAGGLFPSGSSH